MAKEHDAALAEAALRIRAIADDLEAKVGTIESHRRTSALEGALRSLASWVGNGGFNSPTVDPAEFEQKIRDGVERLLRAEPEIWLSHKEQQGFHRLDTDTKVFCYMDEFYPLSNFSAFAVRWAGIEFATSEHAYQWAKFGEEGIKFRIMNQRSAHEAYRVALEYRHRVRVDWSRVKVAAMRAILRSKADQHEYVRRKLLETGNREIIEDSWRDDFWGWGPNHNGKNMLGKLWMEIRNEIRVRNPAT